MRGWAALGMAAGLFAGGTAWAEPPATAEVKAVAETAAVASGRDAADDPAIWRNPADPRASLIVATDKQAGIYVYGLDGKVRSYVAAGQVNNIDLRTDIAFDGGRRGVLVVASDRTDRANARLALFELDTAAAKLVGLGALPAGAGEAYGMCLYRRPADGAAFAFLVEKDGAVRQFALALTGPTASAKLVRSFKLATQSEGCVVDDRTGQLYLAEEDVGLWRISAEPDGGTAPAVFAQVDNQTLFADAEGLAIVPQGRDDGWLVASSQGDSSYAVYRLKDGGFAGRFRIVPGAVDGTSETDGLEFAAGAFGPSYSDGLLVVQDGDNAPEAQNFKLASWADVARALRLK